jgi:hypothetical protein
MQHDCSDNLSIEEALLELSEAEEARLFHRTPIKADALLRRRSGRSPLRVVLRTLSAAAALALVVGLWSWTSHLGGGRSDGQGGLVAQLPAVSPGAFHECFAGPTGVLPVSCRDHDSDADGDVDLADFGAYQLAFSGKDY